MAAKTSRRSTVVLIAAVNVLMAGLAAALLWMVLMPPEAPPPPPPSFQVIVIKPGNFLADQLAEAAAAGGRVPPDQIDFQADGLSLPLAEVEKEGATGPGFFGLLRKLALDPATLAGSVVLRSRDGEAITEESGDPLGGSNMAVMVVPREIVKLFDDPRSAFLLIRMRIAGLQ
jgi:hypothetical protein